MLDTTKKIDRRIEVGIYVCLSDEPLMTGCGNPIGPVVATHSLIKIPISKDQDIKIKISKSNIK